MRSDKMMMITTATTTMRSEIRNEDKVTTKTISDLPDELRTEILSRVPVKSLAKLKPTCKRWYASLKDPKFVKEMFGKAANEVVLLMNSGVYSISLGLDSLQNNIVPTTNLTGKLITPDDSNLKITEIFHCAGLLLCSARNNSSLVVWNPCTGQTRRINPRKSYQGDDFYALGYKDDYSCSNGYKILRFRRYYNTRNRLAFESEMYDFRSDLWRVVNADVTVGNCIIQSHGVSVKGNSYWFATDENDPMGKFILMFDFATERFERLPLPPPFYEDHCVEETMTLSVVGEDQLAVLRQSVDIMSSYKITVWATDTCKLDDAENVSWIHFFTAGFDHVKFPTVTSFLWDEENEVVVCCDADSDDDDRACIYIIGEYLYKPIYRQISIESTPNCPSLLSYVPNLVHIQKVTPKRRSKRNLAARWEGQLRKRR